MLKTKPSLLAIVLASILVGCGGSGDDSTSTTTPNVETPDTGTPDTETPDTGTPETGVPTPQRAALQGISGTLTTSDYVGVPNAQVSINIVDKAGKSLYQQSSTTDSDGVFEAQLPTFDNSNSATSAIVSFEKAGFTNGERLFTIDRNTIAVTADAVVSPVVVRSFKKQDLEIVASSSDKRSVTFSLVSDNDGNKTIQAGTPLAMSETESNLKIDLPFNAIGESVDALTVEMAHFDSADTTDIQSFPGDFVGYGETEEQGVGTNFAVDNSQADAYRLISTTFAQISITDQNGDLLPLSESLAASGETPTVQAYVSPNAYRTITEDVAADITGIQVPIYVYRSSKWEFVGNGSLTNTLGALIDDNYSSTLPEYLQSLNQTVYVSIPVTSANEWVQWINLDWPVFAEPTQTCVTGQLTFERGEAYTRGITLTLPDGGTQWLYADNDGNVSKTFQAVAGTQGDYDVHAFNYFTRDTETYQPPVSASGECDVNIDVTQELMNPFQCSIEGTVVEPDGKTPIANSWIQARTPTSRFYTTSNADGQFTLSSNCEGEVVLRTQDQRLTVTLPDGMQPGDVHTGVTIVRENSAPRISVWNAATNDLHLSDNAQFSYSIYDRDGDNYTHQITCSDACSVTDGGRQYSRVQFSAEGEHVVTITATDEYGKSASEALTYNVKPDGNTAPEIVGFDVNGQRVTPGARAEIIEGQNLTLDVIAIDKQGDEITYAWENTPQGNCTDARCEYTALSAGDLAVTVKATDNNVDAKSSDAALTVSVIPNQAPEVLLSSTSSTLWTANGNALKDWRVRTIVRDDQDPAPTLSWQILNSAGDESHAFTINENQASLSEGTAVQAGEYSITATATDNLDASTQAHTRLIVQEDEAPSVELTASTLLIQMTDKGEGADDIFFNASFSDDRTSNRNLDVEWTVGNGVALEISDDNQQAVIRASSLVEGFTDVTISVTDEYGQTSSSTLTLEVIVTMDLAPDVTLTASHTIVDIVEFGQGAHDVVYTAQFSDDYTPTDDLTVTWTTDNDVQLLISADNTVAIISENALFAGETRVTITVTDAFDQSTVKHQTLVVNVADDAAPEVSLSSNHSTVDMVENGQGAHDVVFTASYSDDFTPTDALNVTWQASNGAALVVAGDKQSATLKANDLTAGTTIVNVTVTDEYGQSTSAEQALVVTVADDEAPTISVTASHANISISEQGQGRTDVEFTASVSDDYTPINALTLNWSASNGAALRVSGDGRTATLLGSNLTEGVIVVTATVRDEMNQSAQASQGLTVDVDKAPVITALTATPTVQKVLAGQKNSQPITIVLSASDDKTDVLSFGWDSNTGITITDMDDTVVIHAGSLGKGSYTVTARVGDELGQETTRSVSFSITEQDGNIDVEIE